MFITAAGGCPELHTTPLASVTCNGSKVVVEVDEVNEVRIQIVFSPYQAIKIITADCFDLPDGVSIIPRTVMEIQKSDWVNELRSTLKLADFDADFMDKARHFLIPLEDDFLEVVAWDIEVVTIG